MKTKRRGNWFSYKNKSHHTTLAIEPLEQRQMLSVTFTDYDVAFHTADQNMWASGPEQVIRAGFSKTLLDLPFPSFNIGGYASLFGFGETGVRASFSGGVDIGLRGYFEAKGGAVAVDYQTDVTITASRKPDAAISESISDRPLEFGEHFIVSASESPDPEFIAMQTTFASIKAGLDLNYGFEVHASLKGKIGGETVFNKGFDKSIHDSVELIYAELNPGTGVGELRLLGGEGNTPFGKTYGINEDNPSLDFEVALGILNASLYVPTLNTGLPDCTGDPVPDPCDNFNDSRVSGTAIFNSQLPVDRSHGQTRIDFFKLGIGLDNIVSAITKVPLNFEVGNNTIKLDVTLIDANVNAYLGIAQRMSFDSNLMVDYNFTIDNLPAWVAVETSPGSGLFQSVKTKRLRVGQDLEIIHPGGTLDIDTDYVLGGRFRNDTDIYLSNSLYLAIGEVELTGSLINTAEDLGILKGDDLSFCVYCPGEFPLGDPIPIIGLFDETFDLGGFSEVDGGDLSFDSDPPTTFTVLALADDPTVTEGEPLSVTGTIYNPDGATDGSEFYALMIDWKDGSAQEQVFLDNEPATPLPSHVNFDPLSGVFTISHTYADQIGSEDIALTVKRLTLGPGGEETSGQVRVEIVNAAPTVSLDPLFLNNNGDATVTGSYRDLGVLDEHTVLVSWGDGSRSLVNLPALGSLSPGATFSGIVIPFTPDVPAELTVESVDTVTGIVQFTITGHRYPAVGFKGGDLIVSVNDPEGGAGVDSVRVPWGFDLKVPSFTSEIDENGLAEIEIRFTDDSSSRTINPEIQIYDLVVDWGDPNDPRPSTFHVVSNVLEQIQGGDAFASPTFASSTDDAVLEVVDVGLDGRIISLVPLEFEFVFTPTFRIERRYADDGDAAAGNNTHFDVSNVVINIFDGNFDGDAPRGGTVIVPIRVNNVAPTLTLDPPDDIGAGGVNLLRGTISDPGRLDTFQLNVNWGDGSTFDNDNDASTAEDQHEAFTFGPSASGSQDFVVPHVYTEDLDGGAYQAVVSMIDDDGGSQFTAVSFVVDFDLPPVAFDDFVSTNTNQILVIDVLADNDLDNTPGDPDPGEDFDRRDVDPEGSLFDSEGNLTVIPTIVEGSVFPASAASALTNNGDGTFSFDPTVAYADLPADQQAVVTFDYQIEDAAGQTDTATVTIAVGVNRAPTAGVLGGMVAYANDENNVGSQSFGGALGHDFLVDRTILVNQLGVFDSGSDGLNRTITAQLWTRDGNTGTKLAELVFTPEEPGTLVGGDRFKPLDEALTLPPGEYTIVAFGYGADEPNGNQATGGPPAAAKTTADAEGAIEFVGSSRFGLVAGEFPDTPDDGPANRYSAGTFRFDGPRSADFAEVTHEDAGSLRLDMLAASGVTDADAADVLSLSDLSQTSGRAIDFSRDGNSLVFDTNQFNDLEIGQSETLRFDFAISDDSGEANDTISGVLTITVEGRDEVPNNAPTISADASEVIVDERQLASIGGSFDDVDTADNVTITASLGTITQDAGNSGDWNWSFNTTDGPDESQPVTITAIDRAGASSTATFDLVVNNVAPEILLQEPEVVVDEGDIARVSGRAGDPGNDVLTMSASIGTIDFDGAAWNWSLDTSVGPVESQTVTITATDSDGAETSATFELVVNSTQDVPADLTGNGYVDFEDLTVLLANWNQNVSAAEGNLVDAATTPVNFEDLTVLLAGWTGPGPAGAPGPQAVAATGSRVASVSTQETTTAKGRLAISDHFDRLGRRDDVSSRRIGRRTERSISPDDSLRRLQAAAIDRAMSELAGDGRIGRRSRR